MREQPGRTDLEPLSPLLAGIPPRAGVARPRVLVVDDNARMRWAVGELLVAAGFDVVGEAADGAGALELVAAAALDPADPGPAAPDLVALRAADAGVAERGVHTSDQACPDPAVPEPVGPDQAAPEPAALNSAASGPPGPEVVVLDFRMPGLDGTGLDGVEVARRLRVLDSLVRVVVFSAAVDEGGGLERAARDVGVHGVVAKGVLPGVLLDAVAAACADGRRARMTAGPM